VSPRTYYRRPVACVKGIEVTLRTLLLMLQFLADVIQHTKRDRHRSHQGQLLRDGFWIQGGPGKRQASRPPASPAPALRLQIGLGVVVGGVEADVPEPASDHRDVDAGRDQMYRRRVPEALVTVLATQSHWPRRRSA
jgi:hypothetical protein